MIEPATQLRDDAIAIFLFHGVIERHRHAVRNYMRKHIDRERFLDILCALKDAGTPLTMDDVVSLLQARQPLPPRGFVITFDDGFRNNLTVAAPALDELEIPATFYATTNFIDQNAMSWIDRIEWCLEQVSRANLSLPWKERAIEISTPASKIDVLSDIRAQVKSDRAIDVDEFVSDIFAQCGMAEVHASDDELDQKMNWKELRELAAHDRFIVGGHSHTHPILSFLDAPALSMELDTSLSLLAQRAGIGPRHYSYPEGLPHCYSSAVIDALKARGVVCCPSAESGVNPSGSDLFHLKRINVT